MIEQGQELGNLSQQQLQTVLTLSILSRSLKNFKLFWDGVNTRWYKWVIGFGSKNQISMLKWFGFKQANVRILIILLVALVSLVVIIQAWILFRRKKVLDPAVRQYQIYCQRLSRIGIVRSNSEGPRAFARRVLLLRPDLRELVLPVVEAYIAIQYAGKISNEQHQKLIRAVRNFKPGRRKIALNNS